MRGNRLGVCTDRPSILLNEPAGLVERQNKLTGQPIRVNGKNESGCIATVFIAIGHKLNEIIRVINGQRKQ